MTRGGQGTRQLVEVSPTMRSGQARVKREAEELVLLGLGDFVDDEEVLPGMLISNDITSRPRWCRRRTHASFVNA